MPLKTTHIISIDIIKTDTSPVVRMKQGDRLTREVTVNLLCDGSAWAAPSDVAVLQLAYCKADKVGGCYDHIDDNTAAGTFNSARTAVTMQLHPQVLNVAGNVFCELRLITNSGDVLNTFNFIINVQKSPIAMTLASKGYYNNVFDGATFIPHISPDGTVSWTNNKNLPNPAPVNVKGPKGDPGQPGPKGDPGETASDAVKYTAQNLTDEQKAQARENIDAFSKNGGEIFGDVDVNGAVSAQRAVIVGENVTIRRDGVHGSNGTLNIDSADDIDLTGSKVHVHSDDLDDDSVVQKKYVDDAVAEIQNALEAAADEMENKISEEDIDEIEVVTSANAEENIASDNKLITPAAVKRITALLLHASYDSATGNYSLEEGTDAQGNPVDIKRIIHDAYAADIPVALKTNSSNYIYTLSGLSESPNRNTWAAYFGGVTILSFNSVADDSILYGRSDTYFIVRYSKETGLYRDTLLEKNVEPLLKSPMTINGKVCYTASEAIQMLL